MITFILIYNNNKKTILKSIFNIYYLIYFLKKEKKYLKFILFQKQNIYYNFYLYIKPVFKFEKLILILKN